MRHHFTVFLCALIVAGVALAGGNAAKLIPKPGVAAADVAKAKSKIEVGTFEVTGPAGTVTLSLACSGQNQTLACDALQGGSTVGSSTSFQAMKGKVNVSMVGATVGAPFKNVTVEVPGTVIQFGGQDMGEF